MVLGFDKKNTEPSSDRFRRVSTRKLQVYLSRQFRHGTAVRSTWRIRHNGSSEHLTMFIRKDVFSHPFKSRVYSCTVPANGWQHHRSLVFQPMHEYALVSPIIRPSRREASTWVKPKKIWCSSSTSTSSRHQSLRSGMSGPSSLL